jgi:glycosyltransferase involved in cell wall biosynthesis
LPTRYHLLFAGKDTYFSRAFLTGLASKLALNDRIHFDNRFIPEKDVPAYFYGCDIVLIPYRKTFSGQSGPLTIAATLGVKIVAPDLTAFEETLSKYDLGCLYPVENLALMADAVEKVEKLPPPAGFEKFRMEHGGPVFTGRVFESYNKTLHQ